MGRVVLTHSTYIKGLIEWAQKLSEHKSIKTITPGVIGKTRGISEKLNIRITRSFKGGYKLIARKGKTYQDLFITTKLDYYNLNKIIIETTNAMYSYN